MPVTQSPNSNNLLLGKGAVYFNRAEAAGIATGLRHLGNVDTFELTTADDVLEKYSSMVSTSPLLKSINRRRAVSLRLTFSEFSPENAALALMGTNVTSSAQAATPIVGELLSLRPLKGAYYKTAKIGPITGVVLKQGVTVLVLGTDYAITNAAVGIIQILPTSVTVTETLSDLDIDYTPTAYASGFSTISGGGSGNIQGSVLFVPDPASGPKLQVEVWSVSIRPDGALALIGEDFAEMALTAAVQDDSVNHPAEPLYKVTYLA